MPENISIPDEEGYMIMITRDKLLSANESLRYPDYPYW